MEERCSVAWCGEDFRWHLSLALQNHYKHTQWHRKWCHEWIYTVGGVVTTLQVHNTTWFQPWSRSWDNPLWKRFTTHYNTYMHSSVYVCMQVEWRESQVCLSSKFEGNWNLKQPQWGNSQLYSNIQHTIICTHSYNSPSWGRQQCKWRYSIAPQKRDNQWRNPPSCSPTQGSVVIEHRGRKHRWCMVYSACVDSEGYGLFNLLRMYVALTPQQALVLCTSCLMM